MKEVTNIIDEALGVIDPVEKELSIASSKTVVPRPADNLEDLDADDAKLLANNVISHTPVKGLTRKTVEATYPELFTTPMDMS